MSQYDLPSSRTRPSQLFKPLEQYGVVGNLETCALVSRQGSVDWFPVPHLESASVFSRLLDEAGGYFASSPVERFESTQQYRERTNVLETTFQTEHGTLRLTDFMTPVTLGTNGDDHPEQVLYRKFACLDGNVEYRVDFEPRFDFARSEPTLSSTASGVRAMGDGTELRCWTTLGELGVDAEGGRATATATLAAGEEAWAGVRYDGGSSPEPAACEQVLAETVDYWRAWSHSCGDQSQCVFGGPWHELAVRSGLVLKLLTHHETGAIAAAPTTSLPEEIGGVRNWDYRFSWIRDAAFTVQALTNLGHTAEAEAYLSWVLDLCRTASPAAIQPLYGLHGESELTERTLDHLSGYRDSQPVRIGNEAADQRQLDIYGELLLAVFEATRSGISISTADWAAICGIVDYVTEIWTEPDSGIWEVRSDPLNFVFSKLMCWVALDRAIDLAVEKEFDAPLDRWRRQRDAIRTAILDEGLDPTGSYFVRSFEEADVLDAATLLAPFVGFLPFDEPRVRATIEAVDDRLTSEGGLVYRYDGHDGLPGGEGTFLLCSFWLVDALALTGQIEEAEQRLEGLIEYVNPVGLLAEEVDESTGHQLGNFPQAFSHIGLINSALHVSRAKGMAVPGTELIGIELGSGSTVEAVGDGGHSG